MVYEAIRRTGESVVLNDKENNPRSFPASIQPRFSPGNDASGPGGWGGAGRYVLYAPADAPLIKTGDEIICRGDSYWVTQADTVYVSGGLLYQKATLYGSEGDSLCKH
jgi:hypothetical protein